MDTIGGFDDTTVNMLDLDVAAAATVRSRVFHNVRRRTALSVELRVTGSPANLTLRVLGQNTAPASDTARLLPLSLDVPDLSALSADYAAIFLIPIYTAYLQIEVQSTSGAVHVKIDVEGTDAAFDDKNAGGTSSASSVQLTGTVPLPTGASTAAKQPALGTAGAAATDVLTVQGAASMTPLKVDGSGVTQPASLAALPALAAGSAKIGSVDVAVYAPFIDTVASADTTVHAYGTSQVIKAPAFVRAARSMTGTVTISDGVRGGMVLTAGDSMVFHGSNLNTLNYQFSIFAATTERFSISAGI